MDVSVEVVPTALLTHEAAALVQAHRAAGDAVARDEFHFGVVVIDRSMTRTSSPSHFVPGSSVLGRGRVDGCQVASSAERGRRRTNAS